jgi:hypothetical protein
VDCAIGTTDNTGSVGLQETHLASQLASMSLGSRPQGLRAIYPLCVFS